MEKNPSPDPPFISHYAIIQGEMGLFLTFSVFELQRGHLYQNGVQWGSDWCWFKLVLGSYSLLLRGYMDLSHAVGHVRECPHSGMRYFVLNKRLCFHLVTSFIFGFVRVESDTGQDS